MVETIYEPDSFLSLFIHSCSLKAKRDAALRFFPSTAHEWKPLFNSSELSAQLKETKANPYLVVFSYKRRLYATRVTRENNQLRL